MPETLIKVDLTQSAYDNDMVHKRWHPDIPMVAYVKPGADFIVETYDWTGGFIKNNDSADDVRDIDLSIVHFLSGPIGVEGAEPGVLLWSTCSISAPSPKPVGLQRLLLKKNGGGFLSTSTSPSPEVYLGLRGHVHENPATCRRALPRLVPSRPDRAACPIRRCWRPGTPARRPLRHQPGPRAGARQPCPSGRPPIWAASRARRRTRPPPPAPARSRRASTAAIATSRICPAARRSTSVYVPGAGLSMGDLHFTRATARSPSAAHRDGRLGPSQGRADQGRHGEVRDKEPDLQAVADHAEIRRSPDLRGHLGGRARRPALPRRAHRPTGRPASTRSSTSRSSAIRAPRPTRSSARRRCRGTSRWWSTSRTPARPCDFPPRSSSSTSIPVPTDRPSSSTARSRCRSRRISDLPPVTDANLHPLPHGRGNPALTFRREPRNAVYDYACTACGPFTAMRPMASSRIRTPARIAGRPASGPSSPRRGSPAWMPGSRPPTPQRAQPPRARRSSGHGAGCGCCAPKKTNAAPAAAKSFPSARPWMISH